MGNVPPLTGLAVKVTVVPAHTVLASGAIVTLAGIDGFTIMVTGAEVTGEPVRHSVALEVIMTLMASPFAGIYE